MSTHTISCSIWNTRPSADLCQIGKFSPSGEIPSLNVGTLSWVTRWSRRRLFWRNLHFQTHCAYQVRGCVNTFCSVSCSARPLIIDSLSSSEARHMGGFVGQLCWINSNNSRGTANMSQCSETKISVMSLFAVDSLIELIVIFVSLQTLKSGKRVKLSSDEVMKKIGELFTLR